MLAWLTSPTKVCPCMLQKGQAKALPVAAKDTLASRAARQMEKRRSGEPTIGRTPKCLVQRILEAVGQSRLSSRDACIMVRLRGKEQGRNELQNQGGAASGLPVPGAGRKPSARGAGLLLADSGSKPRDRSGSA